VEWWAMPTILAIRIGLGYCAIYLSGIVYIMAFS
jgi:hypothetical protein